MAERLADIRISDTTPLPFRHFPREDMTFGLWMTGFQTIKVVRSPRGWMLEHKVVGKADAKDPAASLVNKRNTQRYITKLSIIAPAEIPTKCFTLPCGGCAGRLNHGGESKMASNRGDETKKANKKSSRSGAPSGHGLTKSSRSGAPSGHGLT